MPYEVPLRAAATVAGVYFLSVTIFNLLYLRHTKKTTPRITGPLVSVILPARNEEANIAACLDHLLSQSYTNLEIIVVDDNSEDSTGEIIELYAKTDPRIRMVQGKPLQSGWNGKQFACHQAVEHAGGEILFMTDADVRHGPDSVGYAVAQLYEKRATYVSGYLHQDIGSLGEGLIVPMIYFMTSLLLPIPLLTARIFTSWGFGIGQYMAVFRNSFNQIGGYEKIKGSLVEDMAMARMMKTGGFKTIFIDAKEVASVRMYDGYPKAFKGFAKCIFGAVGGHTLIIGMLALMVVLLVLLPFLIWVDAVLHGGWARSDLAVPPLIFLVMWIIAITDRGIHPAFAVMYPLSFVNIVLIAISSTLRTGFGAGIEWKGRLVRCGRSPLPDPEILNVVGLFRLVSFSIYSLALLLVILYTTLFYGLRIHGRKRTKGIRGGFFLISNHSLYLDPGIIACSVFPRRAYFSAMEETFERPFVGKFIRLLGAFPLPKASCIRRITPAIGWALSRGKCVHFFPEGELHHYGQDPTDFEAGVFYLADRFQVPVVPITLVVKPRRLFGLELPRPFIRVTAEIGMPLHPSDFDVRGFTNRRAKAHAMARAANDRVTSTIRRAH